MKQNLCISIDPGFDSYKIAINERQYHFSSKMIDTTNEEYGVDRRPQDSYYMRIAEADGRITQEYLIGDVAERSMINTNQVSGNSRIFSELQSTQKFLSPYFRTSLQGALALALYMYQTDDIESTKKEKFKISKLEVGEYELFIAVALPHDYVEEYWTNVKSILKCKHNFQLYVPGTEETIYINYDLTSGKYMRDSQVKCAFIYQYTDDNGYDDEDLMSKLPCVVIDGGYKTFGTFFLGTDFSTQVCKSNLDYAMGKVDENVANEVIRRTGRTTLTSLQIKEFLFSKKPITANKYRISPEELAELHEEAVKTTATDSIKYLEKNMELNDASSFIMTGGTAAAYYPYYKEYFEENYGDNLIPVLSSDKPYCGKKIDPIFGVVLGLHKQLNIKVNANKTTEE